MKIFSATQYQYIMSADVEKCIIEILNMRVLSTP